MGFPSLHPGIVWGFASVQHTVDHGALTVLSWLLPKRLLPGGSKLCPSHSGSARYPAPWPSFFFLLNLNLIGPQLWSLLYDPVFGVLISQDNGEECSLAWVELAALFGFFRGTVLPCGLCFPEFQRSP